VAANLEATGKFASLGVVSSIAEVTRRVAALAPDGGPDVVLADIDLGDDYAFGLPAALGSDGPPVVYLSGHDAPSILRAAVESGAAGFVHKRATTDELVAAIRRAVAGESSFSLAALSAARSAPDAPTERERQVLRGIVSGLANKEISHDLCIEERTVESHVRRMLDRYGASNRTELAVLALREDWVRTRPG
jgi:DNA-binding NarL/FixJ family response regulator